MNPLYSIPKYTKNIHQPSGIPNTNVHDLCQTIFLVFEYIHYYVPKECENFNTLTEYFSKKDYFTSTSSMHLFPPDQDPAVVFNNAYFHFLQTFQNYGNSQEKFFLEKITNYLKKLTLFAKNNFFEPPLTLENCKKISIDMPEIINSIDLEISHGYPGCRVYYICHSQITKDITSDIDLHTSAPLEYVLDALRINKYFDGYILVDIKRVFIPKAGFREIVPAVFLTLKKGEIELRVDIHTDVSNILNIANPHSHFVSNFDANTFVATKINNKVTIFNIYEIFNSVTNTKFNYLETGIPFLILKPEESCSAAYIRDPINILNLCIYCAQGKRLDLSMSHAQRENYILMKENFFINHFSTELKTLNIAYAILQTLPKHVILKRLARAFTYGESHQSFKLLSKTKILPILCAILQRTKASYEIDNEIEIIDVIKKIEDPKFEFDKFKQEKIMSILEEFDVYFFENNKPIEFEKLFAFIFYFILPSKTSSEILLSILNIDIFARFQLESKIENISNIINQWRKEVHDNPLRKREKQQLHKEKKSLEKLHFIGTSNCECSSPTISTSTETSITETSITEAPSPSSSIEFESISYSSLETDVIPNEKEGADGFIIGLKKTKEDDSDKKSSKKKKKSKTNSTETKKVDDDFLFIPKTQEETIREIIDYFIDNKDKNILKNVIYQNSENIITKPIKVQLEILNELFTGATFKLPIANLYYRNKNIKYDKDFEFVIQIENAAHIYVKYTNYLVNEAWLLTQENKLYHIEFKDEIFDTQTKQILRNKLKSKFYPHISNSDAKDIVLMQALTIARPAIISDEERTYEVDFDFINFGAGFLTSKFNDSEFKICAYFNPSGKPLQYFLAQQPVFKLTPQNVSSKYSETGMYNISIPIAKIDIKDCLIIDGVIQKNKAIRPFLLKQSDCIIEVIFVSLKQIDAEFYYGVLIYKDKIIEGLCKKDNEYFNIARKTKSVIIYNLEENTIQAELHDYNSQTDTIKKTELWYFNNDDNQTIKAKCKENGLDEFADFESGNTILADIRTLNKIPVD